MKTQRKRTALSRDFPQSAVVLRVVLGRIARWRVVRTVTMHLLASQRTGRSAAEPAEPPAEAVVFRRLRNVPRSMRLAVAPAATKPCWC